MRNSTYWILFFLLLVSALSFSLYLNTGNSSCVYYSLMSFYIWAHNVADLILKALEGKR